MSVMAAGPDPDVDARESNSGENLPTPALRATVVKYEGRPDRRTLYPDGADDFERMTHWLTADDDAFRPLDECR